MQSSVGLCIAVTVLATLGAPAACQDAVPMLIHYQGELRSPTTPEGKMAGGASELRLRSDRSRTMGDTSRRPGR